MKQILWFRRDLRIEDNAILANARGEVLPIFIFDKNILDKLDKDDKRVSFIYKSVLQLKEKLQSLDLELAIFYDEPINVFKKLQQNDFDEVLCSVDFDEYSKQRDNEIEKIIPMKRYIDSFILNPAHHLKKDNTPYKVFTPFFKSLQMIIQSIKIQESMYSQSAKKIEFNYEYIPTLNELGFEVQVLPEFLYKNAFEV